MREKGPGPQGLPPGPILRRVVFWLSRRGGPREGPREAESGEKSRDPFPSEPLCFTVTLRAAGALPRTPSTELSDNHEGTEARGQQQRPHQHGGRACRGSERARALRRRGPSKLAKRCSAGTLDTMAMTMTMTTIVVVFGIVGLHLAGHPKGGSGAPGPRYALPWDAFDPKPPPSSPYVSGGARRRRLVSPRAPQCASDRLPAHPPARPAAPPLSLSAYGAKSVTVHASSTRRVFDSTRSSFHE